MKKVKSLSLLLFMKKILACTLAFLIVIGFSTSCALPINTKADTDSDIMVFGENVTETPESTELTIALIGDSLIKYSSGKYGSIDIPSALKGLIEKTDKKINILEKTSLRTTTLYGHMEDIRSGEYDPELDKADIIIMQHHGIPAEYFFDYKIFEEIRNCLGTDKTYYLLATEFDMNDETAWTFRQKYEAIKEEYGALDDEVLSELIKRREEIPYINYVFSGYAHNKLVSDGTLGYEDLHTNLYHGNALYEYISACVIYGTIIGPEYKELIREISEVRQIPGDDETEKQEILQAVYDAVDGAVEYTID